MDTLSDVIKARACIKLSSEDYEHHCREESNGHEGRIRECPQDMTEANRHIE